MASALLTKNLVAEAINNTRREIEQILGSQQSQKEGRVALAIVVFDPTVDYLGGHGKSRILHEEIIGEQDRSKWPPNRDYPTYAKAKAEVSWRTGLPSHVIKKDFPHFYEPGDFKYGGSAVHDGLVVSTSGLSEENDYNVSLIVAVECVRLVKEAAKIEYAKPEFYISEPAT